LIHRALRLGERLFLIALIVCPQAVLARSTSIVLISVDTLRADHLGSYGYRKIRTPHLDALTHGGTQFRQVDTPVPLTLPAHLSLLSSTYPYVHGVEENGQQISRKVITLPAVLKANGYRTAAFIGGYVLDARFGLNDGFDVYDSPFHLRPDPGEEPPEVKRSADVVLGAAAKWLTEQSGHPFFAFIHLYDVHQPYGHGGYDAEIAYVDEAIGRFQQSLASNKILDDAVIVLTSDHGESLGEHGEETHGYFIYQSTLRVPLVIRWPSGASHPGQVNQSASLIDVSPTLLELLGLQIPASFQGHSLLRSFRGSPPASPSNEQPIYSESMYARDHVGCSSLRSLRIGRYKYIDAPKPEFYDLETDPLEAKNRYDTDRSRALAMKARLLSLYGGDKPPAQNTANPEVTSRLRSLGYLSGGPARPVSGVGPKDRLDAYLRYGRAIRLANAGRVPEAIGEFQKLLAEDRQNTSANFYLAVCYYRSRRLDDAVKALEATLAASKDYAPAEELLGTIWLMKADYAKARQQFAHLAAIAPGNFNAHFNLGILATREGRIEDAQRELQSAARVDASSAPAHAALGSLYFKQGNWNRAKEELRLALAIDPHDEASRKVLEQLQSAGH